MKKYKIYVCSVRLLNHDSIAQSDQFWFMPVGNIANAYLSWNQIQFIRRNKIGKVSILESTEIDVQ